MFKKIYGPLSIQWEVTPVCNYNCIHCYNYWRRSKEKSTGNFWSLENGRKVVDELILSKVNIVTITGGEPLLVFKQIVPHIDKLLGHGIKVSINTNAAYLDNKIAEYLKKRGVGILVSLPCAFPQVNDQITGFNGSFDATTRGIKTARKYGIPVGVNMVVSKLNQAYIISTAEFVKNELCLNGFNATKVSRPVNAGKRFDKYSMDYADLQKMFNDLVSIKHNLNLSVDTLTAYPSCSFLTEETFQLLGAKRACTAGRTTAVIGYDGNVRACTRSGQTYGNLKECTLLDCWDRMSDWRDDTFLPENCNGCNYKNRCNGCCRVDALVENFSMKAQDPFMVLSNLPIQFHYPCSRIAEFADSDQFMFKEGIQFTREEFAFRATINSTSQFITEELHGFMSKYNNGSSFTKSDLATHFNVNDNLANQLLNWLKNSGFFT